MDAVVQSSFFGTKPHGGPRNGWGKLFQIFRSEEGS